MVSMGPFFFDHSIAVDALPVLRETGMSQARPSREGAASIQIFHAAWPHPSEPAPIRALRRRPASAYRRRELDPLAVQPRHSATAGRASSKRTKPCNRTATGRPRLRIPDTLPTRRLANGAPSPVHDQVPDHIPDGRDRPWTRWAAPSVRRGCSGSPRHICASSTQPSMTRGC